MPALVEENRPSPWRGRWLWATLVVAVGCLAFLRLGIWQLDRLSERKAANAHLLERLNQPPLVVNGQDLDPAAVDLRRAAVRGTYDFDQEIVLRNQSFSGFPGAHVLTPLRIEGSDAAVLVDRGWVPMEQASAGKRGLYAHPTGAVELSGVLRRYQERPNSISPEDPLPAGPGAHVDEWFRVNVPRIQRQVPYRLLPVFIQLGDPMPASGAAAIPALTRRDTPVPDIQFDFSNGPHLAYALQWFLFTAILAGGYVLLFHRRSVESAGPDDGDGGSERIKGGSAGAERLGAERLGAERLGAGRFGGERFGDEDWEFPGQPAAEPAASVAAAPPGNGRVLTPPEQDAS